MCPACLPALSAFFSLHGCVCVCIGMCALGLAVCMPDMAGCHGQQTLMDEWRHRNDQREALIAEKLQGYQKLEEELKVRACMCVCVCVCVCVRASLCF